MRLTPMSGWTSQPTKGTSTIKPTQPAAARSSVFSQDRVDRSACHGGNLDQGEQQWPEVCRQRRNESQYRLRLPVAPLAIDQLVLESDASFFDRAYRLTALDADDNAIALTAGRLVLRAEHPRPVALGFPAVRVTALELTVEDGDEAPLAFRAAYGRAIEAELFLAAPAGDYVLLVGEPDVAAPRYELERIRNVILAVNSGSATTGDLAPNPDYSMSARLAAGGGGTLQRVLLWGVLIAAVVVLALVTLRVARSA